MSALSTPTLVVLALFAIVSVVAVLAELALCFTGWPGMKFRAPVRTIVAGFLERVARFLASATRDIVAGFLNGVEWLIYGTA